MSNEVVIRAGCIRIIGRAKNEQILAKLVCHHYGFTHFVLGDPDSNVNTQRCEARPVYRVSPKSLRVRRA